MATKKLAVTDPNGNPILTDAEARERFAREGDEGEQVDAIMRQAKAMDAAAPKERKKAEREPIPTDPAQFEIRHVARLVGQVERAWAQVPKELQDLYRPLFLKPLNAKPRGDLVEVKS